MRDPNLLPCPFCGKDATDQGEPDEGNEFGYTPGHYWVECSSCGVKQPKRPTSVWEGPQKGIRYHFDETVAEQQRRWNTRV